MIKYFYQLLMWVWRANDMMFLSSQHFNSETNLHECEDQSWFKVQAIPVFCFDWCKMFPCPQKHVFAYPRLKTTALDSKWRMSLDNSVDVDEWQY
jgi:hypothetical protein